MKLGILANNVCRICGSETMGADIGCSCKKLYNKATFIALNNNEKSLDYNYGIEMRATMNRFVDWYDERLKKHDNNILKMFKSEFKRKFYPSIYAFYKERGFVSRKQLDIIKRIFNEDESSKLYEETEKNKQLFLNMFQKEHDAEIVEITKSLWKSKKQSY